MGCDFAKVGISPGLRGRVFHCIPFEKLGVGILRHEVQAAISELTEQRGRAPHPRMSLVANGVIHEVEQLRQIWAFEPEAVLRNHELELVPSSPHSHIADQRRNGPNDPPLVWQVQVSLLRDGERREPCGKKGHLAHLRLPIEFRDAFRGPGFRLRIPPRYRRALAHNRVGGHLVLHLARGRTYGRTRSGVSVRVRQPQQLLPGRWDLPDGPALHLFAERRYREEVHPDHAAHGHLRAILTATAVVGCIQAPHADAMPHRLESDGFR
mmetsp:Transcript_55421/g.154417  ORF Transcript_55421/g.154417 Transcript_55421/m.154417 type:complete len:267 (-) Transcript_55421:824-1624(-)